MLGISKKGKNPRFKGLKICSHESYFLLGTNKVSVWGLEKNFVHLTICEIYQPVGLDNLEQFPP